MSNERGCAGTILRLLGRDQQGVFLPGSPQRGRFAGLLRRGRSCLELHLRHNGARIADFAAKHRLPGVHAYRELAEAGDLIRLNALRG